MHPTFIFFNFFFPVCDTIGVRNRYIVQLWESQFGMFKNCCTGNDAVRGGTEIFLDVKKSQKMSGGKDESLIN